MELALIGILFIGIGLQGYFIKKQTKVIDVIFKKQIEQISQIRTLTREINHLGKRP